MGFWRGQKRGRVTSARKGSKNACGLGGRGGGGGKKGKSTIPAPGGLSGRMDFE